MIKFGTLKTKILQKLTEAYAIGDNDKIKEILTSITKNPDFKSVYLFYEEFENKYFGNSEDAKTYLDEARVLLADKFRLIENFCGILDEKIGKVEITESELYSNLDTLMRPRKLKNMDQQIEARNKLIEHLITEKEKPNLVEGTFSENENLLHAVLANNFNVLYGNTLNEEQQNELKRILSLTNEELNSGFISLKEEATKKIEKMITESTNPDVTNKLNEVFDEMKTMDVSKLNYYKLQELKNGL
jgi:hypothetical protein